jgi:Mrp family chromosome partitioning ATPase
MNMRQLLEALNRVTDESQPVAQQDNLLRDLSETAADMDIEWQLREMWQQFQEDDLGTHPKRSSRKGSRHARGHEPLPQYKKVSEMGANSAATTQPNPVAATANPNANPAYKAAMTATSAIKSATGSSASTANLARALDSASQGKPVAAADAKAVEPVMDIINKAATNPQLANQFKTLAQQAKNIK